MMSKHPFLHLRVRSDYSILSAVPTVNELVESASELDFEAMALTDFGVMFGAIQFQSKCSYSNPKIRALHGVEFQFKRNNKEKPFSVLLFPKGEEGYHTICEMTDVYFRIPENAPPLCLPLENIFAKAGEFVVLSGFEESDIGRQISAGNYGKAEEYVNEWKSVFGEDYYLELQNIGREEDIFLFDNFLKLSKSTNVKAVITNPVYYLREEDSLTLDLLKMIDNNNKIGNVVEDLTPETRNAYMKTQEQMYTEFRGYEEYLERTLEILGKCNFQLKIQEPQMPKYPIPVDFVPLTSELISSHNKKYELLDYYFMDQANQGLRNRLGEPKEEYLKRLAYEVDTIVDKGFSGYYLVVADFIRAAREKGILVGPGRGSVAGSLAAYALSITHLDPLKYNLIFERFLNPERSSAPDMDIDFADNRRFEVFEYVREKYGAESVSQVAAFNRLKSKAAFRGMARLLGLEEKQISIYTKLIDKIEPTEDSPSNLTIMDMINLSEELKKFYEEDSLFKKLASYAERVEGRIRGISTHAAGVIIAPGKINKFIPLYRISKGTLLSQFDKDVIESAGLLKMDMLGLTMLSVIDETLLLLKQNSKYSSFLDSEGNFDLDAIPLDDVKTYELFGQGKTNGIFQFESVGMKRWLCQLKPNRLEDLIAMNALFRPGPMASIPKFISNKNGNKNIKYVHPLLEPILKDTYGIIVYQEHVMQIAVTVAGFEMSQADILRKAISKKKKGELNQKLEKDFIQGSIKNGLSQNQAKALYDLIEKFSNYGFNKSHSAGYAYLAYQTGYLKAHFTLEYMAAALSKNSTKQDKLRNLISEVRQLNIELLPPEINHSEAQFVPEGEKIRYGLSAIKYVGELTSKKIVEEREANGKYKSLPDFLIRNDSRSCNKKTIEALIKCGAFDQFADRNALLATLDEYIQYASRVKRSFVESSITLLPDVGTSQEPKLRFVEPITLQKKLEYELMYLDYYASGHPLEEFKLELDLFTDAFIVDSTSWNNTNVKIGCIVKNYQVKWSEKNKKNYGVMSIEDYFGDLATVIVGSNQIEQLKNVSDGDIVYLEAKGTYSEDEGSPKLFFQKLFPLKNVLSIFIKSIRLEIDEKEIDADWLVRFHSFISQHSGSIPIELSISTLSRNGNSVLLKSELLSISLDSYSYKTLKSFTKSKKVELLKYSE